MPSFDRSHHSPLNSNATWTIHGKSVMLGANVPPCVPTIATKIVRISSLAEEGPLCNAWHTADSLTSFHAYAGRTIFFVQEHTLP